MNEQRVDLDLSKRPRPNQIVTMGQGDDGGTTIAAKILDNGAATTITNATAVFLMRMPDGRHYARDENCTVSGDTIIYVVNEDAVSGNYGYTDDSSWTRACARTSTASAATSASTGSQSSAARRGGTTRGYKWLYR